MALTEADIEEFIETLHSNPVLRDRVRNAIIADDFLALPGLVRKNSEDINKLTERMDQLTERIEMLTQRLDRLTDRVDALARDMELLTATVQRLDGRVGNLEGWRFEVDYSRNLAGRVGRYFVNVRPVALGNVPEVLGLLDTSRVTDEEWDDLMLIDASAWGKRRGNFDAADVLILLELSRVVDVNDVERAHRRARLLRERGVQSVAAVDGELIAPQAKALAEDLGVVALVRREVAA